ncbi:not available [Pontoporia blainvillei]|uniref:Not available n=1 Tax=Pontoporia blainvillei TaxID=48723 RepID=A0ABX0SEV3_PONBL|nr:not available [Pontoporia blainvillei]
MQEASRSLWRVLLDAAPSPAQGLLCVPTGPHTGESKCPLRRVSPGRSPHAPAPSKANSGERVTGKACEEPEMELRVGLGVSVAPQQGSVHRPGRLPPPPTFHRLQRGRRKRESLPAFTPGPQPESFCDSSRWDHTRHPKSQQAFLGHDPTYHSELRATAARHGRSLPGLQYRQLPTAVQPSLEASLSAPSRLTGPVLGPDHSVSHFSAEGPNSEDWTHTPRVEIPPEQLVFKLLRVCMSRSAHLCPRSLKVFPEDLHTPRNKASKARGKGRGRDRMHTEGP